MEFRSSAKDISLNVNDEGYVVRLHVSDDGWIKRFTDYLMKIEESSKAHTELAGDDVSKSISEVCELAKDCKNGFDELFGDGAYAAVFGVDLVGVEYVIEFIEACVPYIEERMNKRNEMLSKYDVNRMGGAG